MDEYFFFSLQELVAGVILSLITAGITRALLGKAENMKVLRPDKWILFLIYAGSIFLIAMTLANIDVAYRVITGRIRPGIVRIRPGLRSNVGRTILANSITLTPGTLTVDVDEKSGDFLIHWINVKDIVDEEERMKAICGAFPKWARRLSE
ncbi:MAG: Na+/H+ antiporter subunit E [Thermoplasmatota archaeon]